nr:5-(carboxyamino)imidazole ribonucleotide mutase [Maliibacterium massiliense]
MAKVGIVMGSASDAPVVQKAVDTLKGFGVQAEVRVLSAHRTPGEAAAFAKGASDAGIEVIIAAAGKAAHLPGVLAAYTTLPVIGLPIKSSFLDGMDSLLSMVQMPSGIPVATVAVNGADNAALLAVQILAIKYGDLAQKLAAHKEDMARKVLASDAKMKEELA